MSEIYLNWSSNSQEFNYNDTLFYVPLKKIGKVDLFDNMLRMHMNKHQDLEHFPL